MRILIVDDDKEICQSLVRLLDKNHFACDVAFTLREASHKIDRNEYDLAIVDRTLENGEVDGIKLLRQIRNSDQKNLPVIILSGLGSLHERIHGLNSGADSYLPKPFSKKELIAIVRACLRQKRGDKKSDVLRLGKISLDIQKQKVESEGEKVKLTPTEFRLLQYFMTSPNKIISREEISEHVWSAYRKSQSNTIDVHINSLRRKLGEKIVDTVHGRGFLLRSE